MNDHSIIAAVATAFSSSGIGIIRVSGTGSIELCDKIFKGKNILSKQASHTISYGHIMDKGEPIDEVLVSIMRAPHSYTTEDVVEINCHGGPLILKKVLGILFSFGARPAKPGEFTMRAFLNGRIDLSQAESVMEMISAENEYSLQNAIKQLSGNFSEQIVTLRETLLTEIAFIEAALDDPEHFSLEEYPIKLRDTVLDILEKTDVLLDTCHDGSLIKDGIKTAIIGQVNVGKSSLLNALSGWDKAIVTNIPGTTRDTVEDSVVLGNITLRISDTAGIRESADPIEQIGIEKAKNLMNDASLVLYVIDASREPDSKDRELLEQLAGKNVILCLNKADLPKKTTNKDYDYGFPTVMLSAKELTGFRTLEKTIEQIFFEGGLQEQKDFYITNERHKQLLISTKDCLKLVVRGIEDGISEDLLVIDLVDAYNALGRIIGKEIEDDIVEMIFSKFCIGK